VLPLHPEVLSALNRLPMASRGILFRGDKGGKLTADRTSHLISRFLTETGSEATAHMLRHWFCTKVQDQSGDLRVTQELAGHESPNTTAGYTRLNKSKALAAVMSLRIGPVPVEPRLAEGGAA
jgi:site-specific recombinase XerD